ncbi:MAG TPA: substrate-binding domain-containing protein [Halanaerobiales bacterium]|nr:substrate-binding domain-containing protein [Halanaerobiales bacterium]
MNNSKKLIILTVLFTLVVSFVFTNSSVIAQDRLILATTTSTENSGLLDVLIPPFEEKFNTRVDVVSVGTGKAISLAENGDADIILVHARAAEEAFVEAGYGVNRRDVMYNDFIILGPASDPAGISGMEDAGSAFKKISETSSPFVSRGDDSGTNKKELSIWSGVGIESSGNWYIETGQGMGASLNVANEKQAYILADRGTFLAYKADLDLEILVEGDPELFNPYGIIPVNPAVHNHVNYQMAMAFVGYITSQQGQKIISEYTAYGEVLFNPSAIKPENIE